MHRGIASAAAAYVLWGLFPLYFRQLAMVAPAEVLVHRVLWSALFVLMILAWRGQWRWIAAVARQPRVLAAFAATALLLSANWLTYIWAVNNGHVVDASLGYFITPLVNVLLGYTVLHERPRRAQWTALGLAGAGVAWLTWQVGSLPWIALVLAASFGCYGLLRKIAVLGALEGLALETLWLTPFALLAAALWWGAGSASLPPPDLGTALWLVGIGPVTAVPLLLFAAGARRISMTTLGLLQYLGPTIQFVLGVWVFHEPFAANRLVGFGLIWAALALYSADGWRSMRATRAAVPA
ncbi:MAG: EamA family transporter RarD [Burkholderiaceae bacterium]